MGTETAIAWTDATMNFAMGCMKVSPGCKNCYAETLLTGRMGRPGLWGPGSQRQVTTSANWKKPLAWNREAERKGRIRRVFCSSLSDFFEDHPTLNEMRPRAWEIIRSTPWLDWQLLTKRPENIQRFVPSDWGPTGYANVWLGTSIESAAYVSRAAHLLSTPAPVHFVSYEPALGPLADELESYLREDRIGQSTLVGGHRSGRIDWVIFGGESGAGHRPMDLQWARDMYSACERTGAAFFFKQTAGPRPGMGAHLLDVRQYPPTRVMVKCALTH